MLNFSFLTYWYPVDELNFILMLHQHLEKNCTYPLLNCIFLIKDKGLIRIVNLNNSQNEFHCKNIFICKLFCKRSTQPILNLLSSNNVFFLVCFQKYPDSPTGKLMHFILTTYFHVMCNQFLKMLYGLLFF